MTRRSEAHAAFGEPETLRDLLARALDERNPTPEIRRRFEAQLSRLILREITTYRQIAGEGRASL